MVKSLPLPKAAMPPAETTLQKTPTRPTVKKWAAIGLTGDTKCYNRLDFVNDEGDSLKI
jgi:hypothetical protein